MWPYFQHVTWFSLGACALLSAPIARGDDTAHAAKDVSEIRIRDPFVLVDRATRTYYMYAQMENRRDRRPTDRGVEVYTSQDLQRWHGPEPVFRVAPGFWGDLMVWAPEVHRHGDKYYLFVTFTARELLPPVDDRPPLNRRGTQVLVADSPKGPFQPFHNRPHTPPTWMALDGTLWVEDGSAWMVFCHEWVQITDGTMELVPLTPDLSDVAGPPVTLFRASDASWARPLGEPGTEHHGWVTDGPFLHRTQSGELLMIWSSFGTRGYAVGQAVSTSGKVTGPWRQIAEPLFATDGGHGMIFRDLEDRLTLTLHQPNSGERERARFFRLEEHDGLLILPPTGSGSQVEQPGM